MENQPKFKEGDYVQVMFEKLADSRKVNYCGKTFRIKEIEPKGFEGNAEERAVFEKNEIAEGIYISRLRYATPKEILAAGGTPTLPEEYIVECETVEQNNEVLEYFYGDKGSNSKIKNFHFEYINCSSTLSNDEDYYHYQSYNRYIYTKFKNLPIFTYKQWLQMKENKQEKKIIAYEVIKAFPGAKIGDRLLKQNHSDIVNPDPDRSYYKLPNIGISYDDVELNSEFFKPIYENTIKEQFVKLGNRDILVNSRGEIKGPENSYKIEQFTQFVDKLEEIQKIDNIFPYSVKVTFGTFKFGCEENITIPQLKNLIDVYCNLNSK